MIPKTNNITSNKNMIKNKKIIEVEYEKDYKLEASIKEEELDSYKIEKKK